MPSNILIRTSGALALAAAVAAPSVAGAHGGFPRAHEVAIDPSNPDRIIVRSDYWGIFVSDDGGGSWRLICTNVYGRAFDEKERKPFAVAADGTVFVAAGFDGLMASSGDLCDWAAVPELEQNDSVVQDVVADADGTSLAALSSTGGADGVDVGVWKSSDSGASWTRTAATFDPTFVGSSIGVSPSDEMRIYVAGSVSGAAGEVAVQRSDDGGETFQAFALQVTDQPSHLRLPAIHPTDPDTLFLHIDVDQQDVGPDAVLLSTDGGTTWSEVFTGAGDLPGIALSPDGSTVMVSGFEDGVWKAEVAAVAANGMSAFSQVREQRTFGLEWTDQGLFVGGNEIQEAPVPNPFLLGLSSDQAASAETVLGLCDIQASECGADTTVGAACVGALSDLDMDFRGGCPGVGSDAGGGVAGGGGTAGAGGVGGVSSDAGTNPDDGANGDGCSCRAVGPQRAGGGAAFLLVAVALSAARRRRR